jgi:hypothetical protein
MVWPSASVIVVGWEPRRIVEESTTIAGCVALSTMGDELALELGVSWPDSDWVGAEPRLVGKGCRLMVTPLVEEALLSAE